jgi:heat shock protein HtpX
MAKWSMGVQTVDPQTHDTNERWLLETVYSLARRAGIEEMPEVGVFPSPEVNAFATGATKNGALVAVSAGLLNSMDKDQVEAVLGHEITHVSNGDMVTMTLIQGVINVFVIFFSYVLSIFLTQGSKNERNYGAQFLIRFLLQIVLSILGSIVVAAFSRWREFRADAGGATLAGRQKMISALEALKQIQERRLAPEPSGSGALATLKINGHRGGLMSLFASHPALEERIERLRGLSEARPSSLIR